MTYNAVPVRSQPCCTYCTLVEDCVLGFGGYIVLNSGKAVTVWSLGWLSVPNHAWLPFLSVHSIEGGEVICCCTLVPGGVL